MTEAEWIACSDPGPMLQHVLPTGAAQDLLARKIRLWACACVRRWWDRIVYLPSRAAVETAEQYADELVQLADLDGIRLLALNVLQGPKIEHDSISACAMTAAAHVALSRVADVLYTVPADLRGAGCIIPGNIALELAAQADLLREVVGNPFGYSFVYPPRLTNHARGLALLAYDWRDWSMLSVLADALEETGAASQDILDHLHGPGPHVRGCWALDFVLGRR